MRQVCRFVGLSGRQAAQGDRCEHSYQLKRGDQAQKGEDQICQAWMQSVSAKMLLHFGKHVWQPTPRGV